MLDIGLTHSEHIQQLFYQEENKKLVLIVAKFVDEKKAAGVGESVQNFITEFDKSFKFERCDGRTWKAKIFWDYHCAERRAQN